MGATFDPLYSIRKKDFNLLQINSAFNLRQEWSQVEPMQWQNQIPAKISESNMMEIPIKACLLYP